MAAKLDGDKKLKRSIRVHGVEADVNITFTAEGIELKVVGTKLGVGASWPKIVSACLTPPNVKSFLEGKPLSFLQYQASTVIKKRLKREEKKNVHGTAQ